MRENMLRMIKHPLIASGVVILAGTFISNIINFFFNLYMSRNLSVSDYGILTSLVSIILIFALIAEAFTPTIVHFAGTYISQKDIGLLKGLFIRISKISFLVGLGICVLFIIFRSQLGEFFHIQQQSYFILVGVCILACFLMIVNRSVLQAKLAFFLITIIIFSTTLLKLVLGAALVALGYGVDGALWAYIISILGIFILTMPAMKFLLRRSIVSKQTALKKILVYGGPSAVALLGLSFFITTDIIMVKHFFNPKEAGLYAGLSLIGKVIFFLSAPIGTVMFPLIVQKFSKGERYTNTFYLALGLVLAASFSITLFYFVYPAFSITFFLKNEEYLVLEPLAGLFGIFMSLYALLTIITQFFLSIKKTFVLIPIVFGALLQALLVILYHATFYDVICSSIVSVALPFFILLVYYWYHYARNN